MDVRTTDLGRHKGVAVVYGGNELLTLAPGQSTAPGSLVLAGSAAELSQVTPESLRTEPAQVLQVTMGPRRHAGIEISFRALGHGTVIVYVKRDPVASVTIGTHASHLGARAVDLISKVSNGSDCRRIVAIQQILQGRPPTIIDQLTGTYGNKDGLICGTVVQRAGEALFGRVDHSGQTYHKTLSRRSGTMSFDDIAYDPNVTRTAVAKIKALLDRGTAVRLGAVYAPAWSMLGPNGALQAELSGGHTILAVGYSGHRFLYLDPFPKGSRLKYDGGLPFNDGKTCDYLGILELRSQRGLHLEALTDDGLKPKLGSMDVISGPLH